MDDEFLYALQLPFAVDFPNNAVNFPSRIVEKSEYLTSVH